MVSHLAAEFIPRGIAEPLTIIGASVRAAAESARRAFFVPIAGDLFADADLRETCPTTRVSSVDYPAGLEAVLCGNQAGGWMYTGALENHPDLIQRWSSIRPLYGNGADVLHRVRDPLQLTDCFRQNGLLCPNVAMSSDGLPRDGIWICKPVASAGGSCVIRLTAELPLSDRPVYFQQYIDGVTCGAVFLAGQGDAKLLGVTRQLFDGNSLRYAGSLGPMPLANQCRDQFAQIGSALAGRFSLAGLFGVDAVINAAGVWPVEVNPRYTASVEVLERAGEFSAIALHIDACRNGTLPRKSPTTTSRTVGKAIYFAERDLTIECDLRQQIVGIADVPQLGEAIGRGAPVLTIIREGRDEAEVERELSATREQLRTLLAGKRAG